MRLYVGDYLSGTLHLTTEQHGAYLLLLMTMWRAGASLPNDPAKLARIARVTPKRWGAIWSEIGVFFEVEGDKITNVRLSKEHQKAVSITQERKTAGSKGGAAKALKANDTEIANATDLLPRLLKYGHMSESYREENIKGTELVLVPTEPDGPDHFSAFWTAFPKKKGKPNSERNFARAVKAGADPERIIEGAVRYAKACVGVDEKFIKFPQGWLSDQRWEDPDLWSEPAPSQEPWRGQVYR
jgi:uncharacterized protein YdaU (DUF1376 family)